MPRFYGSLYAFRLNKGNVSKAFEQSIVRIMQEGAREFVRTALTSVGGSFPVDSGMAKGSFLNLSRVLKRVGFKIGRRRSTKKVYYGHGRSDIYYQQLKTPELGAKLSTSYTSLSDVIKVKNGTYEFTFESRVFHYTLNDFYGVSKVSNTPWKTMTKGRNAMMTYIRENLKKLPRLIEYVEHVKTDVGRTGGITEKIEKESITRQETSSAG